MVRGRNPGRSRPAMISSALALAAVLSMEFLVLAGPGDGDPPCRDLICEIGGGGSYVGLTQEQTRELANRYPEGVNPDNPERWFEYSAVIDCTGNVPDDPDRVHCEWAVTYCETHQPGSSGPYSVIYRRLADASGPLGGWSNVGPTCFRSEVPARSGEPAAELTDAMILEQFHRTQFA